MFIAPNAQFRVHNAVIDDALILDMEMFCSDVISAVRRWEALVKNTATYQRNIDSVMRWHPHGYGSYIEGGPVLT